MDSDFFKKKEEVVIKESENSNYITSFLINYLNAYVEKLNVKNELKILIENSLKEDINNNELSHGAKIKILEILTKSESEENSPIINLLGKALEFKKEKQLDNKQIIVKDTNNISQETIEEVARIINIFKNIDKNEQDSSKI